MWCYEDGVLVGGATLDRLAARLGAQGVEITPRDVAIRRGDGGAERLAADRVYALVGFHPDFDLFARLGLAFDATTGRPRLDPETLQTNVPGVYLAGSLTAGRKISEVFIENGRYDGERIFGDAESRARALAEAGRIVRPVGE